MPHCKSCVGDNVQVESATLPVLDSLLGRLVDINQATEQLAHKVLPAVQALLERYISHIRERPKVQSNIDTNIVGREGSCGRNGGVGPLESSLNTQRRRASLISMAKTSSKFSGDEPIVGSQGRAMSRRHQTNSVKGQRGLTAVSGVSDMGCNLTQSCYLERDMELLIGCIGKSPD